MTPAQIRQFVLQTFSEGQSLQTIRDRLAVAAGITVAAAAKNVEDEINNAGIGGTIDFSGLFAEPTGTETEELSVTDPGGIGTGGQGAVSAAGAQGSADDPFGAFIDPDIARQIAQWEEEESLTRTGRSGLFGQFTAQQPGFAGFAPSLQRGINRAFNPLSSQFLLQQSAGGGLENFRTFLEGSPARFGQADFRSALAPIGAAFGAVTPSLAQGALQNAFGGTDVQNNLIASAVGAGISPSLARFLPGIIGERREAFDFDPTDPNQFFRNFLTAAGQGALGTF
jgi:hypothetical protein|tara:strand:- start:251 stop:1099 length:849 start_codon:yes stop_codon:yes gene_type:complete